MQRAAASNLLCILRRKRVGKVRILIALIYETSAHMRLSMSNTPERRDSVVIASA